MVVQRYPQPWNRLTILQLGLNAPFSELDGENNLKKKTKRVLSLYTFHGEKQSGNSSTGIHSTGWWFQTFFMFHNIWDNPSHWLSYFSIWLKPPTSYIIVGVFNCVLIMDCEPSFECWVMHGVQGTTSSDRQRVWPVSNLAQRPRTKMC